MFTKTYLDNCKELNVFEIGDVYSKINSLTQQDFEKQFKNVFTGVNTIIINGFDEFTQPEIEIINQASNITGINLYILFDYYNYNPALFTHLDNCYKKFKAKGFLEVEDNSQSQFNRFQNRVREKLFLLNENDSPKIK